MIDLIHINKYYKNDEESLHVLKDVNLHIEQGEMVAVMGPSGSGKSTLAKMIMGIEKPDSGEIIFDGKDITNLEINKRAKLGISFAFQQPVKFKGITVFDLLKIAIGKRITKKEACASFRYYSLKSLILIILD